MIIYRRTTCLLIAIMVIPPILRKFHSSLRDHRSPRRNSKGVIRLIDIDDTIETTTTPNGDGDGNTTLTTTMAITSSFKFYNNQDDDDNTSTNYEFLYAPIIIGAGQGTTGTHLFIETTCEMGFVSLHYVLGCVPKNAMSLRNVSSSALATDQHTTFSEDDGDGDDDDDDDGDATSHDYDSDNNNNNNNINTTIKDRHLKEQDKKIACPVPIDHFQDDYKTLLKYHTTLTNLCLQLGKAKSSSNYKGPHTYKANILKNLEGIIVWGKEHKVALALHDAPYPLLMPEILKLVQKHYGITTTTSTGSSSSSSSSSTNNSKRGEKKSVTTVVKPIILLSERNPKEYTRKRSKTHGSYTYLCRPTKDQSTVVRTNTNSSKTKKTKKIAIESMNVTTLEGGAFDVVGCMDRATSLFGKADDNDDNAAPQTTSPPMNQIFYSFKEANKQQQTQYIIDTMKNYQDTLQKSAIFSYNMFEKDTRTSVNELASQIKKSMIEALLVVSEDNNGRSHNQVRMKDGMDYLGLNHFFADVAHDINSNNNNRRKSSSRSEITVTHRRRDHGNVYGEKDGIMTRNTVRGGTPFSFGKHDGTSLVKVNTKKKAMVPYFSEFRKLQKRCNAERNSKR